MIDKDLLLKELETTCELMDWYYNYSDDHRVWSKYQGMQDKINQLYRDLIAIDAKPQADAIIKTSMEGYQNV